MPTINKIVHGDCRDYLPKIKTPINALITDPPYGMDFKSNNTRLPTSKKYSQKIAADNDLGAALDLFDDVMQIVIPKLADQAELYVFTAWHVLDSWMPLMRSYEPHLQLKQLLVWEKGYPGLGDLEANWGCGHEVILYLKKGRRPVPKRRSGVIHVDKIASGKNIHPTEKPVGIITPLIEMSTNPGDLIVDPFSGSGSTSVAAQRLGRNSLAFEVDPQHHANSVKRLEQGGLFDE